MHEVLIGCGPLIALWGAATGHCLGADLQLFHANGVRRRSRQFAAHVTALAGLSWLAVLAGLVPELAHAAVTASWGRPSILDAVWSLAGTTMIVAAAFTAGARLKDVRLVPLVPVVCAVVLLLPRLLDRGFAAVLPVQSWWSTARFSPNPGAVLFFVLVAALVVLAAALVFEARRERGLAARRAAALVGVLVLVATAFAWRPDLYVLRSDPAPRCAQVAGTSVCVHPAHRDGLVVVSASLAALRGASGQTLVARLTDQDAAGTLLARPGELIVPLDPTTTRAQVDVAVVRAGLGVDRCVEKFPTQTGAGAASANLALALAGRLLGTVGDRAAATEMVAPVLDARAVARVARLSPDRFRRALADRDALSSCSLLWSDL